MKMLLVFRGWIVFGGTSKIIFQYKLLKRMCFYTKKAKNVYEIKKHQLWIRNRDRTVSRFQQSGAEVQEGLLQSHCTSFPLHKKGMERNTKCFNSSGQRANWRWNKTARPGPRPGPRPGGSAWEWCVCVWCVGLWVWVVCKWMIAPKSIFGQTRENFPGDSQEQEYP